MNLQKNISLQKILAPVDFSEASKHGAVLAAALARDFHARVSLLHVVEPPILPEWGYAHLAIRDEKLRAVAAEKLQLLGLKCGLSRETFGETKVQTGEAETRICETARADATDLIVMASHGLGGLKHGLLGSTAERVVRQAPCPVLTVREKALPAAAAARGAESIGRILVCTDFSEPSNKAVAYGLALAARLQAAVMLLHVVQLAAPLDVGSIAAILDQKRLLEEAEPILAGIARKAAEAGFAMQTRLAAGSPVREICQEAAASQADLLVLGTQGRTGLKHFLLGSVTEAVLRHAPCPVLVVREREHEFIS